MKKKYKVLLTSVAIAVSIFAILGVSYIIYKNNIKKNSAEVVIDQELSINYFDGRVFEFNDAEKEIKFSVINDSDSESMFHIILSDITSKDIKYNLYEDNRIISDGDLNSGQFNTISSFVTINSNMTKTFKLQIKNVKNDDVKFKLNVEKAATEDPNFSQTILNNNTVNKESKTKIGDIASTDEGLILDIDDNGNTFYFRGNVLNNYVNFADKIWRIVRINGDGSVKIILDEQFDSSSIYNSDIGTDKLDKLKDFNNTNIYSNLKSWYENNLSKYNKYISDYKFCIDINKESENLSNYIRNNLTNTSTFNCLGTKNNSKIGLLTVDEVIYAGASVNDSNTNYYLYNASKNNSWWTLSPAKEESNGLYYYEFSNDAKISFSSTGESTKALKPVINLNKDVEMTGKGTKEEPYVLK